jgi:hypothetical protein
MARIAALEPLADMRAFFGPPGSLTRHRMPARGVGQTSAADVIYRRNSKTFNGLYGASTLLLSLG